MSPPVMTKLMMRERRAASKGSLNNKCVFWGVETPNWQGAERGAYSLYVTLSATQPGGMERRSKMGGYC